MADPTDPLWNSPFHRPEQGSTPGTVVPPAAPTPSPGVIDSAALQANLNAIAAACRTPGLTWQQIAAIQAGLPFATPQQAAAAIRTANMPGGGAPAGLPRIPTDGELLEAADAGRLFANSIGALIGPDF